MSCRQLLAASTAMTLALLADQALAQDGVAGSQVEEVIVTAQRRAEQLIDVPATVNVATAERLADAQVSNSFELGQVVSGLSVVTLGSYSQPAIRGVTTQVVGVGNPANVAVYQDGIYLTAQDAYNFDFNAIERIEVLKGPQGVLYGRNATGGAMLITTKNPTQEFGGNASLSFGRFAYRVASLYVTGGITENLSANAAFYYKADDGYIYNITTRHHVGENETASFRGKVLYEPTDRMKFLLTVDSTWINNPVGWFSSVVGGNSFARATPGVVISTEPYEVNLDYDSIYWNRNYGVSLRSDFEFPGFTVTSYSAYRTLQAWSDADSDYSPLPQNPNARFGREEAISQEINASSTGDGPFSWVAGVLGATEDSRNTTFARDPATNRATLLNVMNDVRTTHYSAFADLTYDITDRLTVIGGVRYSYEKKHNIGSRGGPVLVDVNASWDAWTPRLSVKYAIADDTNIYATYSKGFKSGGYNTTNSNPTTPFNPEKIAGVEAGLKTRFAGGMTLDLAAYRYNYKDNQVTASITTGGVAGTAVLNAASARIYGAEAELRAQPLEGLDVQLALAYTHARYTDFPNALITTPLPQGGNRQFVADVKGNRLIRIPDWTVSLGAQYSRPISYGEIELAGNLYLSSGWYQTFNNRLHQPQYEVLNASIAWSPPSDAFKVSLWGKNLTGQVYSLMLSDSPNGDRNVYAPPRTYGVTLDIDF